MNLHAANAYQRMQNAQKATREVAFNKDSMDYTGNSDKNMNVGVSFQDFLSHSINKAQAVAHHQEDVSLAASLGRADLNDVVQASNEAELMLQTTVALRDQIINAYKAVLNTPL